MPSMELVFVLLLIACMSTRASSAPLSNAAVSATNRTAVALDAAAQRRLASRHRIPMHGACAVVARSNQWDKDNNKDLSRAADDEERRRLSQPTWRHSHQGHAQRELSRPMWDFRIKVDPWQVSVTLCAAHLLCRRHVMPSPVDPERSCQQGGARLCRYRVGTRCLYVASGIW